MTDKPCVTGVTRATGHRVSRCVTKSYPPATAGGAEAVASPVTSPAGGTSAVGFSLLMFIVIGALFIVILLHG